ncbi:UvrD-helicase domain-containing protein [Verrucomicrobiota bacterium]
MSETIHKVISASAGAGKTYQLTNRYIGLLAKGTPPERIVALTFTRKAAGEIFDRILVRLAESAADDQKRAELNSMLQQENAPALSKTELVELLRRLLERMPALRIGTLDSFFAQVVRAFPFELGISGDFEILNEAQQNQIRETVLRTILAGESEENRRDFIETFKRLTFGHEDKKVSSALSDMISSHQQSYLEAPEPEHWNGQSVWPDGGWFEGDTHFTESELSAFLEDHSAKAWQAALDYFTGYHPATKAKLNALAGRLLEEIPKGNNLIKNGRKEEQLTDAECELLLKVMRHAAQQAINAKRETTQGLQSLLETYEEHYNRSVRMTGRLTFSDLLFLLNRGPALTSRSDQSDEKLYIDYRLDGKFDHWLLDEFQDTSHEQWHALCNLIDEIIQHDQTDRSFFYVGDMKQAIYGWRGGEAELFEHVFDRYSQSLAREPLAVSWRSAPAVINTVNRVFGQISSVDTIPEAVQEKWSRIWETHDVAPPNKEMKGYAALYQLPRAAGRSDEPNKQNRRAKTVELVQQLHGKVSSIGILVRTNTGGQEIIDALADAGISATLDGTRPIAEQPEVAAFLSLVKLAEHPGDMFALRHVEMSPIEPHLQTLGLSATTVAVPLLHDLNEHGFEFVLNKYLPCKHNKLLQTTREFDTFRNRTTQDYIEYIQEIRVPAESDGSSVTVMTIHKSKGLEFDAVILPALDGSTGLGTVKLDLEIHRGETGELEWVFDFPKKEWVESDPVLSAHKAQASEKSYYEALCLLYVALTRARRGLYIVTTAPSANSKSLYASTLLQQTLGAGDDSPLLYETGEPNWFEGEPGKREEAVVENNAKVEFTPNERPRFIRKQPSVHEATGKTCGHLFDPDAKNAADFGSAVHAALEQIDWLNETPDFSEEPPEIHELLKEALETRTVSNLFQQPDGNVTLWKEKAFEIVLDGNWISGRFDRVVITNDELGLPVSAEIIDWKTGRTPPEEASEFYTEQMQLYKQVLARLTGLPEEQIRTTLAFLRHGETVQL